jgi:hypothetical protein
MTGDREIFRSILALQLDSGDGILHGHLENCKKK